MSAGLAGIAASDRDVSALKAICETIEDRMEVIGQNQRQLFDKLHPCAADKAA